MDSLLPMGREVLASQPVAYGTIARLGNAKTD